jgi:hypothetical protein
MYWETVAEFFSRTRSVLRFDGRAPPNAKKGLLKRERYKRAFKFLLGGGSISISLLQLSLSRHITAPHNSLLEG